MKAPSHPWVKGTHEEYTAVVLEVEVCQDKHGRVWSRHDFQSQEDAETAQGMPQAGIQQMAFALLTEAIRRESFVDLMVEMSKGTGFEDRYRKASPEQREAMVMEMATSTIKAMNGSLRKMALGVTQETLAMVFPGE